MDIDASRTTKAFIELCTRYDASANGGPIPGDLTDDFQKGFITPSYFRDRLRNIANKKLSDAEIDCAWNALILAIPKERLLLLERLAENYNLYLLSNTNQIHYDCFSTLPLKNKTGKTISGYFKKAYYSHEIGTAKPDKKIYEYVIKDTGIQPEETLFIDDTRENVETAKAIGFQTLHKPMENEILTYFPRS